MLGCMSWRNTHYEAGGESHHVGDDDLHVAGLHIKVHVSQHHTVQQRSQQKVHVTDEDRAQTDLHQGLRFLQAGAAYS